MQSSGIQMTSGSLWKNLFFFSLPLMFSQVIEVLFNMSDVAVVGKFADYTALGAVGSTTILVTLFTGFMIGLGNGINVRIAHDLGSGNQRAIKASLHSAFVISFITGVLLCLICNLFSRSFLVLLHTKQELIGQAVAYLKIYSLGFPGLAIYNCGNGILSARGETKRPLMYLSIAGALNVLLNLFFVIVCHMAASGVALASMIAQYTSATFIVVHLLRRNDACKLIPSQIRIDRPATRSILILGIPAGIQNSIFAFANLFVQVGVNSFDAVIVSGNAAAANADTLIYNVMAAFYTGCASFIGQNWGAGNKARILKSYLISLFYSFMIGLTLGGLLFFFGRPFLSLFATKAAVISAGMQRIRIMGFTYCISAFMDCTIAASRGIGKGNVPTVIVILGSCVFRVIWIYTVFAYFHTIPSLYLLYLFSWTITGIAEILYFIHSYRRVLKVA